MVLDITVAGETPPRLGAEAPATASNDGLFASLGSMCGLSFWSARLAVPRTHRGSVTYRIGDTRYTVHMPGAGETLRIAFASCNGAEDEAELANVKNGPMALWPQISTRHEAEPFHVLALGGDQIYADSLWQLPTMKAWLRLSRRDRFAAPFTADMRAELESHYLNKYRAAFANEKVAPVLSHIPSVMIWDDHDIIDGWGSRPKAWQESPVALGLFEAARRAFCLVQLGLDPDVSSKGYGTFGTYGCADIIVPDLRSERTRRRAMGPVEHERFSKAVAHAAAPHTLVVASVPLINADLSPVERVLAPFQPLVDVYQDDMRDQYMSYAHRAEWARVMDQLFALVSRGRRVSVLSGEIHLGALATATRGSAQIKQFIASGIAHPAPPQGLARLYRMFAAMTRKRAGARIELHPIGQDEVPYLAERNWLEATAKPDGAFRAVLHAEESGAITLSER